MTMLRLTGRPAMAAAATEMAQAGNKVTKDTLANTCKALSLSLQFRDPALNLTFASDRPL